MIIVKLNKIVAEDNFHGITLYNYLFMKLRGNYYAPVFYNQAFLNRLIKSNFDFRDFYSNYYIPYWSRNLVDTIEEILIEDKLIDADVSEYLVYKTLFEHSKKFYPKNPSKLFKLVEKYTKGIEPMWWIVQENKGISLRFYGTFNNPIITSGEIIPQDPKTSISHLEKVLDTLYFEDFNLKVDNSLNLLKYEDVYFIQPIKPTDNTIISMVFPYFYVRGQLNDKTAIVNKYKFTPRGNGYFELIRSEIVNDSLKKVMKKETKMKEYGSAKKLKSSIEYFKSKGYLRGPAMPVYHDGYAYLFLKTTDYSEWVSKIKTSSIEININKKYFKQYGGQEIKVMINNQTIKTFFEQYLFILINPACREDFSGGRTFCTLYPHPLRVKNRE